MGILAWLMPAPSAPLPAAGEGHPEAVVLALITALAPEITVAVMAGTPFSAIRAAVIATHAGQWERQHGMRTARAAEHMLNDLGPVNFLTDYGRSLAGLPPLKPSRRNRR